MSLLKVFLGFGCSALCLSSVLLSGCGITGSGAGGSSVKSPVTGGAQVKTGEVFGGQQPISGGKVYMYAAGATGTGSAARSMLPAPGYVLTGTDGSFSLTGLYTCQAGDQVYLVSLGGDAGAGQNASIGLMAAVGPCSGLTPSTFLMVNEVTTAVAASALQSYMATPAAVGSTVADVHGLAAAIAGSHNMVDPASGLAPALSAVGNGTVPQATINSLADSLAGCVNSTDGSQCTTLFSASTVGGVAPTNTAQAAINIAQHPTQNAAAIYNLAGAQAPFQPSLSAAPGSWALSVSFPQDVLTYFVNAQRTGV